MPDDNSKTTSGPQAANSTRAVLSVAFGLLALFGLFPPIMLPAGVVGIILGSQGLRSQRRGYAIAGISLSAVGLVLVVGAGACLVSVADEVGGVNQLLRLMLTSE